MAAAESVTIACKLPHGLMLRIFKMHDTNEAVMGGGSRAVKVAHAIEKTVTIAGFSHPQNAAPKGPMVEGFALTPNVDKEFWDIWIAQNAESDMVKNGLIFAHVKPADTNAESRDKKDLRSGLERLDTSKLPKGVSKSDMVSA